MDNRLVTRYRNVLSGLFSSENAKYTLIHFFKDKYYVNEPRRLDNGALTNISTNWKIFSEEEFERYIERYEKQLFERIES